MDKALQTGNTLFGQLAYGYSPTPFLSEGRMALLGRLVDRLADPAAYGLHHPQALQTLYNQL